MTIHVKSESATPANDWDRRGLPAWTYHSQALLDLELDQILLGHWQIVGHVNDVPKPGDYISFDLGPERAFVLRQQDGSLRAFHNLCRHRGSRIVTKESGHCKNALVCPFHGWVYNFDGTLRGAARPDSFADLDKHKFGLKPVELEVWMGFIFIRFKPGSQASVAETLAPYAAEIGSHLPETMVPTGKIWNGEIPVNWKSVRDVDNEGYHVAMAHPALQDLYGYTYRDMAYGPRLRVSKGTYKEGAGRMWSVRNYVKASTPHPALPEERRKLWAYYGIFPNAVIITTPETVQFYQELPIDVGRSIIRGMIYSYPEESRQQKLARYLSYRIDRATYEEDTQLAIWSNESMKSSAFDNFHLSDHERFLRAHHDDLRRLLPIMRLDEAPPAERMADVNAALQAEQD
mgnify:CR=1 FL=1